mmetsp:Transcript_15128/g.34433  ORF Transcript_15128/g.34433 Transcript_15128/m.34433 type:complete len:240 (+) Transcript_15128:1193-1912(+)
MRAAARSRAFLFVVLNSTLPGDILLKVCLMMSSKFPSTASFRAEGCVSARSSLCISACSSNFFFALAAEWQYFLTQGRSTNMDAETSPRAVMRHNFLGSDSAHCCPLPRCFADFSSFMVLKARNSSSSLEHSQICFSRATRVSSSCACSLCSASVRSFAATVSSVSSLLLRTISARTPSLSSCFAVFSFMPSKASSRRWRRQTASFKAASSLSTCSCKERRRCSASDASARSSFDFFSS